MVSAPLRVEVGRGCAVESAVTAFSVWREVEGIGGCFIVVPDWILLLGGVDGEWRQLAWTEVSPR